MKIYQNAITNILPSLLCVSILAFSGTADAAGTRVNLGKSTFSPVPGVVCDNFVCADANGISSKMILKYLGKAKAKKWAKNVKEAGEYLSLVEFTFQDGVFCDAVERLCHIDRYYSDGHRSKIAPKHTQRLFGKATKTK